MIDESLFQNYLNALLAGRHGDCRGMVQNLIDMRVDIKDLYERLFQRSMYRVGELWENNKITVAREHLATSITESLLNLVYPSMFAGERTGKKTIISCSANEFHQIGGKMVADIFEFNGWDGLFLGANTPPDDMLAFIHETKPDVVGLSLSLLSNAPDLKKSIEIIRYDFPQSAIWVGGQAFRWGGTEIVKEYSAIEYIPTLKELEKMIKEF
jgi:methanogenic corrinoid protein MtbC1